MHRLVKNKTIDFLQNDMLARTMAMRGCIPVTAMSAASCFAII